MTRNQLDYVVNCRCLRTRCASVYCESPVFAIFYQSINHLL